MILANGKLGKKSYNKEIIGLDELETYLKENTDLGKYLNRDVIEFSHPKDRVSIDRLNEGRIRRRQSVTVSPQFNFVDNKGSRCNLRYFEDSGETDKGVMIYTPYQISVFKEEEMSTGFNMDYNRELAVFLLMHPSNVDSPFHTDRNADSLCIHDPKKESSERAKKEIARLNILNEIKEMSIEKPDNLRRIAKGIKIGQDRIFGIDFTDMDSVVVALMDMSARHPAQDFTHALRDHTNTILRGAIIDAIDFKFLTVHYEGAECVMKCKEDEVCRFAKNMEPSVGFLNYIVDNNKVPEWQGKIYEACVDWDFENKKAANKNKK